MQELNFGFPGVYENFEACREMASGAVIERTYFVTSPRRVAEECTHMTRSLPTAIELWTGADGRLFSVAFEWSIGDESGAGSIRYGEQNKSTLSAAPTESSVRDLIVREITNKLFERLPRLETI